MGHFPTISILTKPLGNLMVDDGKFLFPEVVQQISEYGIIKLDNYRLSIPSELMDLSSNLNAAKITKEESRGWSVPPDETKRSL